MKKRILALILVLSMMLAVLPACAEPAPELELQRSETSLSMQDMLESDPELMALMEKSIAAAAEINPDPDTNPVRNVNDFYNLLDWATVCMPWNVLTDVSYPTLYESIDQSIDYIWFLLDQPLPELEGKGYYYPTLQYHEPIASWWKAYSDEWGAFLNTEDSWNDIYYQRIKNDPSMNMQYGWYADTNVWHTFNEWFSRHLIDPSVRPIADSTVVAPADSKPQGIWPVDEKGDLDLSAGLQSAGLQGVGGGVAGQTGLRVGDFQEHEVGALHAEHVALVGQKGALLVLLDELEGVGQNVLAQGDHVVGLIVHEVVQIAVGIAVGHLLALDERFLELGGGVERGFGHAAGDDVSHLGAHEGSALAGLDVLELHNLVDLAVHLKGFAVSEITCGNGCHICFLQKTKNIQNPAEAALLPLQYTP